MSTRNVFMDFSPDREISFTVGPHTFHAHHDLPLSAFEKVRLATQKEEGVELRRIDYLNRMVDVVCIMLLPESAERFREMVANEENLIGANQVSDIHTWLMEEVVNRPTQESSDSSPSSEDTGESLTDGPSAEESI